MIMNYNLFNELLFTHLNLKVGIKWKPKVPFGFLIFIFSYIYKNIYVYLFIFN